MSWYVAQIFFFGTWETAWRKCLPVEMTWVLQVILPYLPSPRPRTEDLRLYGKSVSQRISSLSVSSNCDKIILPTKHILHKALQCRLSLWHVWVQGCEQYMHHKMSFSSQNWEKAGGFPLWFSCIASDWLSSLLFWLFDSFHPYCWNHHFGIRSDDMCTLLPKRIAYTFKWSYGILDTRKTFHVNRTWMPIICPKIYPACGPLHTMQASSDLGHCVSVKPIMPPSQRTAIHALGHG